MRYVGLRRDNLRSHFVFGPRHAPEWLRARFLPVVFLTNKEELTGKTFTTSLTTTNPNTYVKFIFLRTSPLRTPVPSGPLRKMPSPVHAFFLWFRTSGVTCNTQGHAVYFLSNARHCSICLCQKQNIHTITMYFKWPNILSPYLIQKLL